MVMKLVRQIIILLLWLTKALALAPSLAEPDCQEKCGNVSIPYPFGIGAGCFMDEWFEIICKNSSSPHKPFIRRIDLELLDVSLSNGTLRVNNPLIYSNCPNRRSGVYVDWLGSPFSYSDTSNRFTAMSCNSLALITRDDTTSKGCASVCNTTNRSGSSRCNGINCCQTTIPAFIQFLNVSFLSIDTNTSSDQGIGGCKYAFMVDQEWFFNLTDPYAVQSMEYVPAVLDWGVHNGTNTSVSTCYTTSAYSSNYQCICDRGYEGNPYLSKGCQDIDECADPFFCDKLERHNNETPFCRNLQGWYSCDCPHDHLFKSYQNGYSCSPPKEGNKSPGRMVIVGTGTGFGILFLLIGAWWLYKVLKRRQKIKLKEKFFKRNGGLLLQQQLSSREGNIEKGKLFTSKELEKATDHYNENRILGQGGQGTVYKGMLTDGRIVAVKKSKLVDESKLEQFINEVVILSEINHRNVVKLLGCCLETEVPLLVYEFIPNGTLFQHIHDQNEEFPISWEMRLRIATEVAGAISYLHSAASIPIYHRDIKSTNILLDDKYIAKVSDFGTSRSIAVDQTHLTTLVQGTFGYLDPEYFQSSQFTDKSDVYSFGVVLVELLTGQKAISSIRSEEGRSLATYFIISMKENHLFDILDARVLKEGRKEEIIAVANLAKRCLNLNGKKRPTMKEVAIELEGIRMSQGAVNVQQNYEEIEYAVTELSGPWNATSTSTSTGSSLDKREALSSDIQPLLFNKS